MEVFDILILGAELSMALAGFAGIIATFQFRDNQNIRRADAMGLNIIVVYSLLAALQCGVILILNVIGVSEGALWTTGSILVAFISAYNLYLFNRNMDGAIRNKQLLSKIWLVHCASVVIFLANILNAADIVFHKTPGPFLAGVALGLGIAGWMFARLLLRPIWQALHKQEASEKAAVKDSLAS